MPKAWGGEGVPMSSLAASPPQFPLQFCSKFITLNLQAGAVLIAVGDEITFTVHGNEHG